MDRSRRPPTDDADAHGEGGYSLAELSIVMLLLGIVMAITTSGLMSAQRVVSTLDIRDQSVDAVRLAVADMDRQVRSGNIFYDPTTEQPSAAFTSPYPSATYSIRIYTQANGANHCVQWRLATGSVNPASGGVLQTRAWQENWRTSATPPSGWRTVATGLVVPASTAPAPFRLDTDNVAAGTPSPFGGRVLDIDLNARVSPNDATGQTVEITDSIAGRNTEYGYDPNACSDQPPVTANP